MSKQPGVMFYFDVRPCLERLTPAEKGRLFEAILDYAQFGQAPQLEGMLGVAWDFIRPRLDRDRERYASISQKRAEAALTRWTSAPCADANGCKPMQTNANGCKPMQTMPTTTSKTTSTPSSASASASAPTPPPLTDDQRFDRRRKDALRALAGYGGKSGS